MQILRNTGRRSRKRLWELLHQVLNHIIADGLLVQIERDNQLKQNQSEHNNST